MFKLVNRKMTKLTWKNVLLYLVLSQTIFFIMQQVTIPRILRESDGLTIFDVHFFGYTYAYALEFLSILSKTGYRLYQYAQIPLDLMFPILNFLMSATLFLMLVRTYRKIKRSSIAENLSALYRLIFLVPFIAMLADYMENVMVFIMLSLKSSVPELVVTIACVFTVTKTISFIVFYSTCFIFSILICIAWMKQKQTSYSVK